jgi:hypothetical protein
MVWSREALPSYLYGFHAKVEVGPDGPRAVGTLVDKLLGPDQIPAGLFRDPAMSYLSATSSCTLIRHTLFDALRCVATRGGVRTRFHRL